jgi:hypothetical protein
MSCMRIVFAWTATLCCQLFLAQIVVAQDIDESIVSRHLRLRIPAERQWLGRDNISDLERCWEFVHATAGGQLPGRVLIVIEWQDAATSIDMERSSITLGMNDPNGLKDANAFLLHSAARGLARLSLSNLMGDGASQPENRFLLDGMSEMLAHEFSNTVRRLDAAWTICHYVDKISPLGLMQLSRRSEFAGGSQDLVAAAPGIAFLTFCSEVYGRDRVLKLFDSLAQKSLEDSLAAAFKTRLPILETQWLNRVRGYVPQEFSISADEPGPALDRVIFNPEQARPGTALGVRLYTHQGRSNLSSTGIFLIDESSSKVRQGHQAKSTESLFTQFEIPIESARQDGRYRVRIVAVDNGGNVRIWEASYTVTR